MQFGRRTSTNASSRTLSRRTTWASSFLQRSRRPQRVPTVLSPDEVRRLIDAIDPARMSRPMIELMYGAGMRVSEVCTLRIRPA